MTSTVLAQPPVTARGDESTSQAVRERRTPAADRPPIERPRSLTIHRFALAIVTAAMLVMSLAIGAVSAGESVTDTTIRFVALALALVAFASGAAFGVWAFRRRTTIDGLRWLSFRRQRWGGWWSVVWTLTPVVAFAAFVMIEAMTDSLFQTSWVLVGLVVVRIMSIGALGANMKRVVLDGRRWVRAGATAVALADFLVVAIAWTALVQPELDRDLLRIPTTILPMSALLAAVFSLSYAKRVERWVAEWWDKRWGTTERDAVARFSTSPLGGAPAEFTGRRLIPTTPLRMLVLASYLVLAGATSWSGWTVWTSHGEFGDAATLEASLDRLDEVSLWFVGALILMQVCHATWCIAQAWNARRCTLGAPSTLGTAVLFLLGPAIAAGGVVFVDDADVRSVVVAAAVIVNLTAWALSFSLLSRMLHALGRSTDRISSWGFVISLHWLLLFGVRPIVLVDDAAVFAGLVFAVAVLDATILLKATVHAQLAMREVERATVAFGQVRRRPTTRRRWSPAGVTA